MDEAVDAFRRDHRAAMLSGQKAANLFWRPTATKAFQHLRAQPGVALQPRALPAPSPGLGLRIGRFVADLPPAVALQLSGYSRWRAIQSCRDLPDRAALSTKCGNRTPVFQRKLVILSVHRNTLIWCCTSFENLGDPYVDGPRATRVFWWSDRIACIHMSGLLMRQLWTAGQDGFRDASSKQPHDLSSANGSHGLSRTSDRSILPSVLLLQLRLSR